MNTSFKQIQGSTRATWMEKESVGVGSFRVLVANTDQFETEEGTICLLDMPGLDQASIEIEVDSRLLTVKGSIEASLIPKIGGNKALSVFQQSFLLNHEPIQDGVFAQFYEGCLQIKVFKDLETSGAKLVLGGEDQVLN